MTSEQLNELERLDKEATKGPWRHDGNYDAIFGESGVHGITRVCDFGNWSYKDGSDEYRIQLKANYDLICALRNACPDLLALARIGLTAKSRIKDHEVGYAAMAEAQDRAIKAWQEANPNADVECGLPGATIVPGHQQMVEWLLDEVAKLRRIEAAVPKRKEYDMAYTREAMKDNQAAEGWNACIDAFEAAQQKGGE